MPESPYDRAVKRLASLWVDTPTEVYGVVFDAIIDTLRCSPTALAKDVIAQRRVNDEASGCS